MLKDIILVNVRSKCPQTILNMYNTIMYERRLDKYVISDKGNI